jgi:hypothetical protein
MKAHLFHQNQKMWYKEPVNLEFLKSTIIFHLKHTDI